MRKLKSFLFVSALIFGSISLFAQESEANKEENKKLELKLYGFIKGDMVYSTAGVTSFGANTLGAPQLANGVENSAVGLTAQHTRLGIKGSVGEEIKVGGLVEIDFFSKAFDANGKPRIRLGYASVTKGGFQARMGQQWDIFSPNNANTNNTNGNLWFAGNRGFRRAQLLVSYTIANETFAPMLQLSLGETTREDAGLGMDNLSGVPMFQARLSGKLMEKYTVGVSYVNGQYLEKGNIGPWDYDFTFKTTGIGVDINLPIHKYFSLVGEFNTGTNLNNANLFNIAGNYTWNYDVPSQVFTETDAKSMGYWLNATSNLTDWFIFVLGYGTDINKTDNLADGKTEANTVFYTHFNFPVKHGFSFAFEYQNINTAVKGGDNLKANVISLAGKVVF